VKIDYLWEVKQYDAEPLPYRDLASSAVVEPTTLMRRHLERFAGDLELRLGLTNAFGLPVLRDLILQRYAARSTGLDVQLTNGASGAIWLTCQALLQAGDEVIIEHPVYEPLLAIPEYLGAKVRLLPRRLEDDFQVDREQLAALITSSTRLVILTNLHNPSGAFSTPSEMRELATVVRAANASAHILVDETFLDHVPNRVSAATIDSSFISISGLTKVYGLALLRCGWIMAQSEVIERIRRFWVLVENSGSRLTEALASIVLEHLDDYADHAHEITLRNRALAAAGIAPLIREQCIDGELPRYGTIMFPRVLRMPDSKAFAATLRKEHRILVASGHHFGDPTSIRIGFGRVTKGLAEDLHELAAAIVRLS
jgi:aspartate/methionine/tyrosine aminotransferase